MSVSSSQPLLPVALRKEGTDQLVIEWNDGHRSIYTWKHLRQSCPCASCRDELFGPILTAYVYDERRWEDTLQLVDETAPYGLTGAVFANERQAIEQAHEALRYAAGNFYVNDKPTGAVVGQQPFGGARASGTNDKAGSMWNLIRWVSPRTIKETFVAATDYRYPFLAPDGDGSTG